MRRRAPARTSTARWRSTRTCGPSNTPTSPARNLRTCSWPQRWDRRARRTRAAPARSPPSNRAAGDDFLEPPRHPVDRQVNRYPPRDDEVPVERILAVIDEALLRIRSGEGERQRHAAVSDVRGDVDGVHAEEQPHDGAVGVVVPAAVNREVLDEP